MTAATPNFDTQRLFFNVLGDTGTTLQFTTLDLFIFNGGASPMGVELRAWGGAASICSPLLVESGIFSTPAGFAGGIVADVSSLPALHAGEGYQFSLSFYDRDPASRIGLSGERSDMGFTAATWCQWASRGCLEPSTPVLAGFGAIALMIAARRAHCRR